MSKSSPTPEKEDRHDPYAALRYREFRILIAGRFITSMGNQMLAFAISWELWLRTRSAFGLGLVGLVQGIPIIVLSLPAGHIADQHIRRRIVTITQVLLAACSLGLALLSLFEGPLMLIYLSLFGNRVARAFHETASSTLLPKTMPPEAFTNAATWSSSSWQFASIVGTAIAGALVAALNNVTIIYFFDEVAALTFLVLVTLIIGRPLALAPQADTLERLKEGLTFIKCTKTFLSAITLDMFAVLLAAESRSCPFSPPTFSKSAR